MRFDNATLIILILSFGLLAMAAVLGIQAAVENITFRIRRREYRKEADQKWAEILSGDNLKPYDQDKE